jgi:regulator of sigma E protease
MLDVLIFIAVLSVLIIVHEWGHFITARRLGVRVEKFSVGFGPKLFSRVHDGTEFLVSAVPLGGYVKMAGDERNSTTGDPGEFYSQSPGRRALIVFMGPMVNFIFAYLCFYFIFVTGYPLLSSKIGKLIDGLPAQSAGLLVGDHITEINNKPIDSWDTLQATISKSGGVPLEIHFIRNDVEQTLTVMPKAEVGKNIFGEAENIWLVGVQPVEETQLVRYGLGQSFFKAGAEMTSVVTLTFKALYRVFTGTVAARDALAGPIRIFNVIKNAATMGIASLVLVMAVISTSLAIFNVFPIPVLDGGHLLFFLIEKIRGRPLPASVEENFTRFGLTILLVLMGFVCYNDVIEVGWVDKAAHFLEKFRPK